MMAGSAIPKNRELPSKEAALFKQILVRWRLRLAMIPRDR
jgi:hypothetical protein